jgi:tRNA A-37 threonylcarbamoyl transferase component Bud32
VTDAGPPENEDERTVFVAGSEGAGDGTVFLPGMTARPATLDPAQAKGIKTGDVLNHIFEVHRFIARGGMGEVFEGANVITHERVAIKVMLPALAADAHVITLFHREARTLTRLHHEAVVQYRVLAQEPQLGVLYIVTEYIDGTNLADMLGVLRPSTEELIALLRRLASGLQAAHALGAVHRDISPDNILLGDGRLDRAKIIDFGIAKDLDPGTATIVGDGFAGKLGYVAPEQIGDFGRRLGPWTDVYSLGLVMLAIAGGRDVGMGGSLVDAVDKRRAGPDLSVAPAQLRPLLGRMTRADPAERLGSMDTVLAELYAFDQPVAAPRPRWLVPVAAVALLVIVGLVLALTLGHRGGGGDRQASVAATPGDPVQAATVAVDAAVPSVSCTWLTIADITPRNGRLQVALTGVAGDPSAAQTEIGRTLSAQHIGNADLDFAQVSPITPAGCAALDAYRQISGRDPGRLTVPQRQFEMRRQPAGQAYAGEIAANAVIGVNIGDPSLDFALVGLEPSGKIDMLIPSRTAFAQQVVQSRSQGGVPITDRGGDRYRLQLDLDHQGWSGLLLVTGKGPFDAAVVAPPLGARGADWRDRLVQRAAEGNWQATMVWFKSVDAAPD